MIVVRIDDTRDFHNDDNSISPLILVIIIIRDYMLRVINSDYKKRNIDDNFTFTDVNANVT